MHMHTYAGFPDRKGKGLLFCTSVALARKLAQEKEVAECAHKAQELLAKKAAIDAELLRRKTEAQPNPKLRSSLNSKRQRQPECVNWKLLSVKRQLRQKAQLRDLRKLEKAAGAAETARINLEWAAATRAKSHER